MVALSPVHRLRDGMRYPAVIDTPGANDPRVAAWIPAKFAAGPPACLQAAQIERYASKPALLRVDFEGGHAMGSGVSQRLDETADVWSFFLWQFGDVGFAPKR